VAIVTVGRDAIVVGCRRFLLLLFDKGKRFQQEELKIATGGGANFRLPWVGPLRFWVWVLWEALSPIGLLFLGCRVPRLSTTYIQRRRCLCIGIRSFCRYIILVEIGLFDYTNSEGSWVLISVEG